MKPTTPRGALTPNLAEQLDKLVDQGRRDQVRSDLGLSPASSRGAGQPTLFQSDGADGFVSFDGQTL